MLHKNRLVTPELTVESISSDAGSNKLSLLCDVAILQLAIACRDAHDRRSAFQIERDATIDLRLSIDEGQSLQRCLPPRTGGFP